jgi:hypothetical protein
MANEHEETSGPISSLHAIEVNPCTDQRWEDLVNTLPESSIYHHPAWSQVIEEAYNCRPAHLACEDESGRLWGILPLLYKRGVITGRDISSLIGTPVAGPVAYNDKVTSVLLHAFVDRARSKPDFRVEIRSFSNALNGMVRGVVGAPVQTNYVVELPDKPELLTLGNASNKAAIKRAVNKAFKLGVQIRLAETERELWAWYRLYVSTMRRLGALPRSYEFFQIAWRRLQPKGLLQLLLAQHHERGRAKLQGGLLLLTFGQTVHYAYGGWSWENQALRTNDALHWQAMQNACADGFRWYDLGTASDNDRGLARYKKKWGAKPMSLYSYRYHPSKNEFDNLRNVEAPAIQIQDSASGTRRLALAVLGRLPIRTVALISKWGHHL